MLKIGTCHHIRSTVRNNVHDSRRAQLKCRLLTGKYILQANRAAFNQYTVNSSCKLCSVLPETRQHFIAKCVFLEQDRKTYVEKLIASAILSDENILQLQDPEFLTQLTLDCSVISDIQVFDSEKLGLLELYTREYISGIHMKRFVALRKISGN